MRLPILIAHQPITRHIKNNVFGLNWNVIDTKQKSSS